MSNKIIILFSISFLLNILSCQSQNKETIIEIKTEFGDIKIKLYDETPLHKANFIKLIKAGFYNDRIFHRVIKNFMIQGGDEKLPENTENAMNRGMYNYTIPAEINRKFIHKRGALAAARMGDNVNPNQESSPTQFYIVQGEKFTDGALNQIEAMINNSQYSKYVNAFYKEEELKNATKDSLISIENQKNAISKAKEIIDTNPFTYNESERNLYKNEGGTPHLDMNYTVFGEIISGMEVIDKIAEVQTGSADRPLKDIRFSITIIE
jgi:peptidylprolyl isomerase